MKNQEWKLKYQDLKIKFHDSVDLAFRLGFEQGSQQAQLQQAQQQAQQAQAQLQAMQQPGMPGQDPNAQPGQQPSDGSELDEHISTLESQLSQAQPGSPEQEQLQKSLDGLKAFKMSVKNKYELNKTSKPAFTLSASALKNMSEPAKKALTMQEQIVADVMKSMEEEELKVKEAVVKTLNLEQILKG